MLERVLHTKVLTHPFKFKATAQNGVSVDLIVRLPSTFNCLGVVSSILALFTVSSNMRAKTLAFLESETDSRVEDPERRA